MPPPFRYAHQEHIQTFNLHTLPSQAPRTSRSPPSFNGDHFISPGKMGTQMYDAYASMPPSASSASRAREQYAAFQSSSNFQTHQMMVQDPSHNHQPENPVARFLLEESSWDPLMGRQQGALLNHIGPLPDYTAYRNTCTTAPSEADTVGPVTMVSDSGYGSMPRQSVGIPSVYGGDMDHCTETQSLIRGVSDFQFHGLSPGSATPPKEEPEGNAWSNHEVAMNTDSNDLMCPTCKIQVKTKSEIKKHEQRHLKPHRCDMENCPRKGDGFSTLNDLARHKQTVHKVGGTKYRCNMGSCVQKIKDWPRADNFKQHLFRVHGHTPDNLEGFIYRPDEPIKPPSSDTSESLPPQLLIEAQSSSVSVSQPEWDQDQDQDQDQADIISPSTDLREEVETDDSDNAVELSDRSPSIDGSSLGDVDEGQYRIPIPFDGMGLDENIGHMIPQYDMTGQHFHGLDNTSSEQMMDTAPTCINPDILNHMGLRTSFPGEQAGRSQVLELEPDGQFMFSQGERETELHIDEHNFPSSHQVTEDLSQGSAVEGENDIDADDSGGSVSAEQSFSPPEIPEDVVQPANTEPFKPEPRTAVSTPESLNLDETDANTADADASVVEGLMMKTNAQKLNEILQKLGYRMVKESDVKETKDSSSSESQVGTNAARHGCDRCKKTFSRACELRKHRKRHDKPYACTYAQCEKRFGSKNDWKRHENSQHFQLECWKCNEKAKDNGQEVCGKVCHRRETFTNHLEKDHGLGQKAIEQKWAACRVGRNCETRFWCGFCKSVVELEGRGGLAWTERFNHIDEHFNGRNGKPKVDISEWKSVESEPLESIDFLQTGKPQERDYRGRFGSSGSAEQLRKRHRSESSDRLSVFRRKRIRPEDGEVFWSCCSCHNVWSPATTGNTCMDCSHTHCDECTLEAHSITEDASSTLML